MQDVENVEKVCVDPAKGDFAYDYQIGSLTKAQGKQFQKHLRECEACARNLKGEAQTRMLCLGP